MAKVGADAVEHEREHRLHPDRAQREAALVDQAAARNGRKVQAAVREDEHLVDGVLVAADGGEPFEKPGAVVADAGFVAADGSRIEG